MDKKKPDSLWWLAQDENKPYSMPEMCQSVSGIIFLLNFDRFNRNKA